MRDTDTASTIKEEAKELFETKTGLKLSSEKGAKIFNNAFNSVMATAMDKTSWRTLMTIEASNILQDMAEDFDALPAEKPKTKPRSQAATKTEEWHIKNFLKPKLFDNPKYIFEKDYKTGAKSDYVTFDSSVCNAIRKTLLAIYWAHEGRKMTNVNDAELCKEVGARIGIEIPLHAFSRLKSKMRVPEQKKLMRGYILKQQSLGTMKSKSRSRKSSSSINRKVITVKDLSIDTDYLVSKNWAIKKKD